jgi:hypothetical protein
VDQETIQTLFTSGFSFNVPTPKIVNALKQGDNRKAVAILDFKDWAKKNRCHLW